MAKRTTPDTRRPTSIPVERVGLLPVEQLERRSARGQDHAAAVRPDPRLLLGEAQGVAVEGDGGLVVVDRQCDPELVDGGHGSTVANDPSMPEFGA
jgi:hypothetical protein